MRVKWRRGVFAVALFALFNQVIAQEVSVPEARGKRGIESFQKKTGAAKPETKPQDEEPKVTFGGRIQADVRYHMYPDDGILDAEDNLDWFEFRRVEFEGKAKFAKRYKAKISAELNDGPHLKSAYLDTLLGDATTFQIGQEEPPFGVENYESSKYIKFLERTSIVKALSSGDDRGMSLFGKTLFDYLHYNVSVLSGSGDAETDNNNSLDFMYRLAVNPTPDSDGFFNIWIGNSFQAGRQTVAEDEAIKIKPETESGQSLFKAELPVDQNYTRYKTSFDVTMIIGPALVRSEYMWATYDFEKSASISGGYIMAAVFMTGEQPTVEDGYSERQAVDEPTFAGGWGAVELAARYSWFSASDEFFQADGLFPGWEAVSRDKYLDHGSALTLGVNWYLNPYLRWMFNWVATFGEKQEVSQTGKTQTKIDTVENAFLVRAQFEF